MEELAILRSMHTTEQFNSYADDNLKMVAFNLVKKNSQQSIKMVVAGFSLKECKDLFYDKIIDLISNHYYKEVSYYILFSIIHNVYNPLYLGLPYRI